MANSPRRRVRPHVELLEERDLPSGLFLETFEAPAAPELPPGWSQWSSLGTPAFATSAAKSAGGSQSALANGRSDLTARLWRDGAVPADTAVGATVLADSLIPLQVIARGRGLDTDRPTYYAAEVTRGLEVRLLRVVDGQATQLGFLRSRSWLSGKWVEVRLTPRGSDLRVQVVRTDTGEYLNSAGFWQSGPANALRVEDGVIAGAGLAGVNRAARYAGPVYFDDFSLGADDPAGRREDFDAAAQGQLPAGWQAWSDKGFGHFGASDELAASAPNSLAGSGNSATTARAWLGDAQPADVRLSASVFLGTLIPTQLLLRGRGLDSPAASYYAVTLTRGAAAELVRVVDGRSTVLGSVRTAGYFSQQWVRVTFEAEGAALRVGVQRLDTGEWLTPLGEWQAARTDAIVAADAALPGGGQVGFARPARFAGTVYFDDLEITPLAGDIRPPEVSVTAPAAGQALSGTVTVRAEARDEGGVARVEFYLDGVFRSAVTSPPYEWRWDTTGLANGTYSLEVRAYDSAGNVGTAGVTVTVENGAPGVYIPDIPRHYSHIRVAQLAYFPNPMGPFEQELLRTSVDLVIPNPRYLETIEGVAPQTPQLIYTNVSNIYLELLTDWLRFADRAGVSREGAFYHAAEATPFLGSSSSSLPVNYFWSAQTGPANPADWSSGFTDVTGRARGSAVGVPFGGAGSAVYVGYTDRFREINWYLSDLADPGWSGVLEYVSAVDAAGNPTQWKPLPLLTDATGGWRTTGHTLFDPPADWKPASVGGSAWLYFVRVRVTAGDASVAPVASRILGRDYVRANGGHSGVIPAFDHAADLDGDGYLNDAEYARRAAGKDARFVHESRVFHPLYGQMRFATNPSGEGFAAWAVDFHRRLLEQHPLADGLFLDNSNGRLPLGGAAVLEATAGYSAAYAEVLGAMGRELAPKWLTANTVAGRGDADAVVLQTAATFEEFALRPLAHTWAQFRDLADTVARRQSLASPAPYLILDSLPQNGSPTDPRTQMATLAYYYLLADPETTFLTFFGGSEPYSTWTRHWVPAAAYDVGRPLGDWSVFATGQDPANPALTYEVYQREYGNALVLYKPLSYTLGKGTGTTGNATATAHALPGNYRVLNADGTLGPVVNRVTLRNGEGAVLIRA